MSSRILFYVSAENVWNIHDQEISYFVASREYREHNDMTGKPVVFGWTIFLGHTPITACPGHRKDGERRDFKIQPHDFKDRRIFMSMYNDNEWTKKDNRDTCYQNSSHVSEYAPTISCRRLDFSGHFSAPEMRKKWHLDPLSKTRWRMDPHSRSDDGAVR